MNAVRHAQATAISIDLYLNAGKAHLKIIDNGRGIQLDPESRSSGMGLGIMKYRAGLIGAELTIRRRKSGGTEVLCCIPYNFLDIA